MEKQIPDKWWQTPIQRFWTAIWFSAISFIPSVLLFRTFTFYGFYGCLTLLIIPVLISGCFGFVLNPPMISRKEINDFFRQLRFIIYPVLFLVLLIFILFSPVCFLLILFPFLEPLSLKQIVLFVIMASIAIISLKYLKSKVKWLALAGVCLLIPLGISILWQTPNLYNVPIYPGAKDVSISERQGGSLTLITEIKFVSEDSSNKISDYYQQSLVDHHWIFEYKDADNRLYFRDGFNDNPLYLTIEENVPKNFTILLSVELNAMRRIIMPL